MTDSAALKIDRASNYISQLSELFKKSPPFEVVVKTNVISRDRYLRAKANVAVIDEAALICGDVIHNLRTAIDHAYWDIISPHVTEKNERRKIQFPFGEKRSGFKRAMKTRYAALGGFDFVCGLVSLRPYLEDGGNKLLHLIHELDAVDKHQLLLPTVSVTKVTVDLIRKHCADFPARMQGPGVIGLHGPNAGFRWHANILTREELGEIIPPTLTIFERKLDIPVDVIFDVSKGQYSGEVIPLLNEMTNVTREVVAIIRRPAGR
ncbi:MAG: hypothetical protein AB7V13_09170 [Pseudorhodoplanes sp.]|uniref:hypothetical protein n=1 Tax=Pseudorhodoplanes sp. TaxID=1934341 RepID=UPI003D12823B